VQPPPSPRKYWTRKGIAQWLVEQLQKDHATIVGIDHGFSFPLRYFEVHHLLPDKVHFWPFDGWEVSPGCSAIVEVYPSLWSRSFPREDRNQDQHDAYSVARWLLQADTDGNISTFLSPSLNPAERTLAQVEGWILGVM
jgi:hypothetical protein